MAYCWMISGYSYLAQVDLFHAFGVNSHLKKYNSMPILVFIKLFAGYTTTHDSGEYTDNG